MAYTPHPHHRSTAFAGKKSQWIISLTEEVDCYQASTASVWFCGSNYWGLHLNGTAPTPLGLSPNPDSEKLHIAKFVGDDQGNWHGYPVAPWLSPYDKPNEIILMNWLAKGLIKKQALSKIHRGKKCAL